MQSSRDIRENANVEVFDDLKKKMRVKNGMGVPVNLHVCAVVPRQKALFVAVAPRQKHFPKGNGGGLNYVQPQALQVAKNVL